MESSYPSPVKPIVSDLLERGFLPNGDELVQQLKKKMSYLVDELKDLKVDDTEGRLGRVNEAVGEDLRENEKVNKIFGRLGEFKNLIHAGIIRV